MNHETGKSSIRKIHETPHVGKAITRTSTYEIQLFTDACVATLCYAGEI